MSTEPPRLSRAGTNQSDWISILTTEHYSLQTQRAATIDEENGRASIFLGTVSAGLIAMGFQTGASANLQTTTIFRVVILSTMAFLGVVTFLRCLEIAIDDSQFRERIVQLRLIYAEIMPDLANLLARVDRAEQATAMLTRRPPFQKMLSVAGSIGMITSIVTGADLAAVLYGLQVPLIIVLLCGVTTGLVSAYGSIRFQQNKWRNATRDV